MASAAPFQFAMSDAAPAFSVGVPAAAAGAGASAAAAAAAPQQGLQFAPSYGASSRPHVPAVLRADSFPASLVAPSLPACPLLRAAPALHPHRGRVLLASAAASPGEPLLHEAAFVTSNWDSFRCAECDRPHATRRCAAAKKKWAPKILKKIAELEATLSEASLIGSLDHARSFMKLLRLFVSESALGSSAGVALAGAGGTLSDLLCLSSSRVDECVRCLDSKLPYQSSSPKQLLEHAGVWPSGLSVRDAGLMLAILNTNSHELTDVRGSGIFLRASLMEHSCLPNCNFSTTGREMQILALRPVQPGDNLSIDYGEGWYRPVSERRAGLLKSHGFLCFCVACTSLPDKSRAFSCPATVNGARCPGVVYPVGADDKEAEVKAWAGLVESGQQFLQEQAQAAAAGGAAPASPLLPVQSVPSSYPTLQYTPWSCCQCRYVLNSEQIAQCQQREREAAKALRDYSDEMEEDEEAAGNFDFGGKARGGDDEDEDAMSGDEEDEDEDGEDDGDEIPPPGPVVERLTSLPAPALHPSHHLIFWSLDFYARSCSSDADFAADAVPLYEHLLRLLVAHLSPEYAAGHDSLVLFHDYLAQVQVVTGAVDAARQSFARAHEVSQRVNGAAHHSTKELAAMLADMPTCADELAERYAAFQAALEAALFDSENAQAEQNKKKKQQKKLQASEARRVRESKAAAAAGPSGRGARGRDAAANSDSEDSDDDAAASAPGPLHHAVVTPETRAQVLSSLEQMALQRAEEQQRQREQRKAGGDDMQDAAAAASSGSAAKGKGKGKKK